MNFYKNVIQHKGKLLVRRFEQTNDTNREVIEKIDFSPTLYSLTREDSKFKTLQGQNLKPITFNSIGDAMKFRKEVATANSPIFGLERYHYQYINEQWPDQ